MVSSPSPWYRVVGAAESYRKRALGTDPRAEVSVVVPNGSLVAVTGGSGYVGRRVVPALVQAGYAVRAVQRGPGRLPESVEVVRFDLAAEDSAPNPLAGARAVVHLASMTANLPQRGKQTWERVNVQGMARLIGLAEAAGCRRLVHVGGIGGADLGPHRWITTRWRQEELLRASALDWTILRPSVLFGGDDAEFLAAQARAMWLSPFAAVLGSGALRFQPLAVEDLVACVVATIRRDDLSGQTLELGGPDIFTLAELVRLLRDTLAPRKPIVHLPEWPLRLGAAVAERLLPKPPLTTATLDLLHVGDNVPAQNAVVSVFGLKPESLPERLRSEGFGGRRLRR